MARQRRGGGGFRGPELRGTLGTLLRTTLQQAGVVRDALERGAREGRSRLDDLRANRRRTDALAELGELVLALIRDGEIDLDELPEARELVRYLDELDQEDSAHHHHHHHDHDDDDHEHPHPAERRRSAPPTVNDRPSRARPRDELADAIRPATRQRFDDRGKEDGTVSSARWAPPKRSSPAEARVWRPPVEEVEPEPEPAPKRAAPLPNPHRKGGISFESDDDLADYMHPDDVPPKSRPDGES